MDPSCGVLREYVVDAKTGVISEPDGKKVGRIIGNVIVAPRTGHDQTGLRVGGRDVASFELTFPRPGNWTIEVTLEDTSGHRHTETRFVRYRPGWPEGWSEVASLPSAPSGRAVKDGGWLAFCEGSGLLYAAKGHKAGDFYRYEPVGDRWSALTPLPWQNHPAWNRKPPYKGAVGCSDGANVIYATQGNNTLGFWAYFVAGDSWHVLPDVPLGPSGRRVKGGTDLCYVVDYRLPYVYLLKGYGTEFCRFNIAANSWEVLPAAPAGTRARWDQGSWLAGDGMGSLYAHKAKYHELWRFDIHTGAWYPNSLPSMPYSGRAGRHKKLKDGGSACWSGNRLYALKGGNIGEFWRYDIAARVWTELDSLPSVGRSGKRKRVKNGADIVAGGVGTFHALKGNKTPEFWRYVEPAGVGSGRAPQPGSSASVGALPRIEWLSSPARPGLVPVRYVLARAGLATVSVFDATGRAMYRDRVLAGRTGTLRLDLRTLGAGLYFVRLDAGGLTAASKLVMQK